MKKREKTLKKIDFFENICVSIYEIALKTNHKPLKTIKQCFIRKPMIPAIKQTKREDKQQN